MKAGIEAFIGIILITLMVLTCVNFMTADAEVMNARSQHSLYMTEIANSYFSDSIINECKNDANDKGYALEVTKDYVGRGQVAYVSLTYTYSLPLLGINKDHTISGCAR